jgi:hypothetical protein
MATAWLPSAMAKSPVPPTAVAVAPLPKAIAKSPMSEVAVAELSAVGSRSNPSMEIWKSGLSAEAIPGVDATVAPIPRPTASMPSRAKPRALIMTLIPLDRTGGHRLTGYWHMKEP